MIDLTSFLALLIYLIPISVWLFIKFNEKYYRVWEKRGIPSKSGSFPFGSNVSFTRELEFQGVQQQKMYNEFSGHPLFGFYYGNKPMIMLRDPEYIKIVMTMEFSHFRDRQGIEMNEDDPLAHHLFNLEGDKWRALRVQMTPIFTSGKLKGMFQHFVKCAEDLDKCLSAQVGSKFDVKETTARFSTDVICSCAFGWEVNALGEEDSSLRKLGKQFMNFQFSTWLKLKMAMIKYLPWYSEAPYPKFIAPDIETFMIKAVKETIKNREKSGQKRNDFIDLLMHIQTKKIFTEDEQEMNKDIEPLDLTYELMTAQCFVFFLAGFETSSSVQSFCLYEISLNQEIQERLHKEIEETISKHGGLTYRAIQDMQYLNMVVNETMRKYPTLMFLTRRCVSPFAFPNGITVERGDRILIPLWSIHRDPEHFPNPEEFNPERFAPENKDSIRPYTFLPFGEGPRICIGSRFGLLQSKIGIITTIRKYKLTPAEGTTEKLEYDNTSPLLTRTAKPIYLNISNR